MKAIILVKDKDKAKSIYSESMMDKFGFNERLIAYTKEEIATDVKSFTEVKYIFSTWYMPTFNEKEIRDYFPALEAVFYAAGTVKYFAEPFMKSGVKIFSAAKANGVPVAEFTASQIILANKGYFQAQKECKRPFFKFSFNKARQIVYSKTGNYQARVGLIGAGAVGSKVVELLKPYNLDIYVYDPYISDERAKELNVLKLGLEELFDNCDVISNHLPDVENTRGILNYSLFSRMKSSATFINTGRGAQVVERDLTKALREKPQRCALLDVTSHEPLWPWSPLNWQRNVFITPHIAGSISQEEQRMAEYMCQAYDDFVKGRNSPYEVTLEMLNRMA